MLDNRKFSTPLDVGSGLGMLSSIGINDAVGIDIRKGGAATIRATAESLPFQDALFDLVFAGEVLEHLEADEQLRGPDPEDVMNRLERQSQDIAEDLRRVDRLMKRRMGMD